MATTNFEYVRWRYDYEARVECAAMVYSLIGQRTYPGAQQIAMSNFVGRRRVWLGQLLRAKYAKLLSVKFGYARNCPPCSAIVTPRMQPCLLYPCPFCYARRVSGFFRRMWSVIQMLDAKKKPWRLVSYRIMRSPKSEGGLIQTTSDGSIAKALRKTMALKLAEWRDDYKARFPETYYAISWWGLEPFLFPRGSSREPGWWKTTCAALAVVPPAWQMPEDSDHFKVVTRASGAQLATMLGKTFLYPRNWTMGPVDILAQQFNVTTGTRFFRTQGIYYRGVPNANDD